MSAIALDRVSKHWTTAGGKVHAVDGITFAFEPGTLNVLLGPSGCGKSTTLRLIAVSRPRTQASSGSAGAMSRRCRPRHATSRWYSRAMRCFRICR
jgi:ABC-type multidrug transport system ATPase subunit